MAYGLKYYATLGADKINIYQRDYTGGSVKIYGLQSAYVGFVSEVSPEEPVQKTECVITLVDAPDLETDGKSGDWGEFYTPDPLLYRVEVLRSGVRFWRGYVTPDSWEEELRYHGSITITARDNFGALSEYPFEWEDDRITLEQVIAKVAELTGQDDMIDQANSVYGDGIAMPIYSNTTGSSVLVTSPWDVAVDKAGLDGMSWLEVLEAFLSGLGLVLRWYGKRYGLSPIGKIRTQTFGGSVAPDDVLVTFRSYATRRMQSAFKQIDDSITYDYSDEEKTYKRDDFSGSALCAAATGLGDNDIAVALGPADATAEARWQAPSSTLVTLSLTAQGVIWYQPAVMTPLTDEAADVQHSICVVWEKPGGTRQYYNVSSKTWQTSKYYWAPYLTSGERRTDELTLTTPSSTGTLVLILSTAESPYNTSYSAWTVIGLSSKMTLASRSEAHEVTTKNTELASLSLSRDTKIGQFIGSRAAAQACRNCFKIGLEPLIGLSRSGDGARVRWSDVMAYVHTQLLCAYLTSEAVIEGDGECDQVPWPQDRYTLLGVSSYTLWGGKFELGTYRITGGVWRHIYDYDELYPLVTLGKYRLIVDTAEGVNCDAVVSGGTVYITQLRTSNQANAWVVLSGRLINGCPGSPQPYLPYEDRRSVLVGDDCLERSSAEAASWAWSLKVPYNLFGSGYITFGPARWADGDDGGPSWTEAPMEGSNKVYLELDSSTTQ